MILTGTEIIKEVERGTINIKPFSHAQVNPNSYNYRLGTILRKHCGQGQWEEIILQEEGYVLEPGTMYLAHTAETLGSTEYAMSLIGRSSLGRLGLFLQLSANIGHTGSTHKWTLELVATKPLRIYPGMIVGQISFWCNKGNVNPYVAGYSRHNTPMWSRLEET